MGEAPIPTHRIPGDSRPTFGAVACRNPLRCKPNRLYPPSEASEKPTLRRLASLLLPRVWRSLPAMGAFTVWGHSRYGGIHGMGAFTVWGHSRCGGIHVMGAFTLRGH